MIGITIRNNQSTNIEITTTGPKIVTPVQNPPVVIPQPVISKMFEWRGFWQSSVTYEKDDVVFFQGSSFICVVSHISTSSFDSQFWELMAQGASASDSFYLHEQPIASASWVIDHNLGKYPSVTIVDSSNEECEGNVLHVSLNRVIVSFSAAFSGRAFLN